MQPFGTFADTGAEAFLLAFTFRAHLFSAAMRIIKNLIRIICELFLCLLSERPQPTAKAAKRCSKSLTELDSACHASPSDYGGHFERPASQLFCADLYLINWKNILTTATTATPIATAHT